MKKRLFLGLAFGLVACGCSLAGGSSTESGSSPAADNPKKGKLIDSLTPTHRASIARGTTQIIQFATLTTLDSSRIWVGDSFTKLFIGSGNSLEFNTLESAKLGLTPIKVTAYKGKDTQTLYSSFTVTSPTKPTYHKVRIISSAPHSKASYTQGLLIHQGQFYESIGQYGLSALQTVEPLTGKITKQRALDRQFFGEGLTLLNNKLYQLTWMEEKCFVYDASSLKPIGQFSYQGQGWGLATDGQVIYMSNGSNKITVRNPQNFEILTTIQVYQGNRPLDQINELEWIDGKIWANIYLTGQIAVIDPLSGTVEKMIDCSILTDKIGNLDTADVLNGIARDPHSGKIYLTGKLWDKVFEVVVI